MEFSNTYSLLSEEEPTIHELPGHHIDKAYSDDEDDQKITPKAFHYTNTITNTNTNTSNLTLRPRILNPKAADFIDSLPNPTIHKQVTRLLSLQAQKQRHKESYQAELLALENKYLAKCKPLYQERATVVTGADLSCDLPSIMDGFAGPPAGIPEFWLTVMQNHPSVRDVIQSWDEEVLSYLTDIRVELLEAPELGFRLVFDFAENAFFENKMLKKTYTYERGEDGAGLFYGDVFGDTIFWREGRELPPSRYGFSQESDDELPPESFFDFFNPPNLDPVDDEELDILEMKLALDYGYGEVFKEKLIPDAVDWFIGEAAGADQQGDDQATNDDWV
ncbi:hypothetical protein EG329_014058 [Mollisiaceae sp. DMI_Dod_QoI]|nr:hypothetical protein EG329_014058 [Helotiales sp. DMI_Dod_QoI]